jgi:hypothetical protein
MAKRILTAEAAAAAAKRPIDEVATHAGDRTDLVIQMSPEYGSCSYTGTRAALEAEGIIPAGTEWPIGFIDLEWDAGQFRFLLRRFRPDGAKGPRKIFAECDWWNLYWKKIDGISWEDRAIARKTKELKATVYWYSEHGQRERYAQSERFYAARRDQRFQAFKALIPGLVRSRRGRKAESEGGTNVQ